MHLLIILVVAGILLYLLLRSPAPSQTASGDAAADGTLATSGLDGHRIAFISRGKLFYADAEKGVNELHSPYVQGVMDKMERARQRQGWKKGTAFEMSFTGDRSNLPSEQLEIKATTAQFTPDGRMLYFLRDESVGGLFEYDFETASEKRLIHRQKLLLDDLSLDPDGRRLACTQRSDNGSANIGVCDADGANYREVTGGDTVDSAPAWIPKEPDSIVYQSSGIARDQDGFVVALGPATLQLMDLQQRELTTVKEDDAYDFLQPRVAPSGDLYFIRRPYEAPRYRGGQFLTDFLLFPFRLVRALFHYLNFFSLMYSRKPLTSASGPRVQADLKEMLVKGRRIDAENALRKESRVHGIPSLVPKSWQLVRRNRNGDEHVVATNVATYDIAGSGEIIYSNGYGVFILDPGENARVMLKDKLITDLVVR